MAKRWEELERQASKAPTLKDAMHLLGKAERSRRLDGIKTTWVTPANRD